MTDATAYMGGRPINSALNDNTARAGQSSFHPGGSQIAMGDGKVRFVSENASLVVLRNVARPSDGGIVGQF
jgi:hypothetical protein